MATNWVKDIYDMHSKYGVHTAVSNLSKEQLREFLKFRVNFLNEELEELKSAIHEDGSINREEVVDALIDLCVVAIGTLDLFNINAYSAWNEVYVANMNKKVGIKESRPNPFNLPDLIKPDGWAAPCHVGNYGKLNDL